MAAEDAQKALTEVASVPFGASREQTVQILGARFGTQMPKELQKPDELCFTGGEFAGMQVDSWWFRFAANKLYEVSITFATPDAFASLDSVSSLLTGKYGAATSSDRSYSFPYNIPFRTLDVQKVKDAFHAQKAAFYSMWYLSNGTIFSQLSLSQGEQVRLYLTYSNSEIAKLRSKEVKSDL